MSSIINYVADGSTSTFQIPFNFIDRAHVVVTVDGTTITPTFINDTQLSISPTPTSGLKITVKRQTPTGALVDFTDGSTLFEADLDLAHKQNRFIAEESSDRADSAIDTLNANITNINTVASNTAAINTVSGSITNVNSVATNMAEVLLADTNAATATTKASEASVSATASEASKVISVTKAGEASASAASALASKNAASTSETNAAGSAATATTQANLATTQASNAAGSASTASTQAGIVTTKATEAATSATNAATSETNAATSASSAEASKDAALAALDSFDDRYLGQKATDPTLDNDGDALVSGALYFDTADGVMKVYDGSLWVAAYASLSSAVLQANNLSDLANVVTSRTNLGLGSAATTDSTAYATAAQGVKADASVQATATTGQANLPSGTTAQRTAGPIAGAMRFNSTDTSFEGYNGTEWGSIGGGAADGIFYENEQNVTANYTIAASKNAMTTGPITIDDGVSVTIETGARWVVL